MNIRQAARWAERKDALYIHGDFNNPMCAVWASNTHAVLCIGSYDKCRAYIQQHCACEFIPTTGRHFARKDGSDYLRMDSLDDVVQGMDESEAEALLPERDYRHEGWAH
jgi:hypothetical protein